MIVNLSLPLPIELLLYLACSTPLAKRVQSKWDRQTSKSEKYVLLDSGRRWSDFHSRKKTRRITNHIHTMNVIVKLHKRIPG